jgi:hypothetical protein
MAKRRRKSKKSKTTKATAKRKIKALLSKI